MKTLALVAAAAFAAMSLPAGAAIFSSTRAINQQFTTPIAGSTTISNNSLGIQSTQPFSRLLTSGTNSVTLRADTVADTAVYNSFQFRPYALTLSSQTRNVAVTRVIIDVPANFPLPAVTHTEVDTYMERLTFGNVGGSPAFNVSTTGNVVPGVPTTPTFLVSNVLALAALNFTVTGTYEVTSPGGTTTIPFSVVYEATNANFTMQTRITGGPAFGDGFAFAMRRDIAVTYRAVNNRPVNQMIGELNFSLTFPQDLQVRLLAFEAPEPATGGLAAAACAGWTLMRRRTRRPAILA